MTRPASFREATPIASVLCKWDDLWAPTCQSQQIRIINLPMLTTQQLHDKHTPTSAYTPPLTSGGSGSQSPASKPLSHRLGHTEEAILSLLMASAISPIASTSMRQSIWLGAHRRDERNFVFTSAVANSATDAVRSDAVDNIVEFWHAWDGKTIGSFESKIIRRRVFQGNAARRPHPRPKPSFLQRCHGQLRLRSSRCWRCYGKLRPGSAAPSHTRHPSVHLHLCSSQRFLSNHFGISSPSVTQTAPRPSRLRRCFTPASTATPPALSKTVWLSKCGHRHFLSRPKSRRCRVRQGTSSDPIVVVVVVVAVVVLPGVPFWGPDEKIKGIIEWICRGAVKLRG
jgi:hypothetical protein